MTVEYLCMYILCYSYGEIALLLNWAWTISMEMGGGVGVRPLGSQEVT